MAHVLEPRLTAVSTPAYRDAPAKNVSEEILGRAAGEPRVVADKDSRRVIEVKDAEGRLAAGIGEAVFEAWVRVEETGLRFIHLFAD